MKNIIILLFACIGFLSPLKAQEYNASLFGCVSDGITNNTSSIQYAINFIAEKGGGKLNFYVGRYLTGGLHLKSNVTIELHEGAVLLASPNFYDYVKNDGGYTLISGENVTQVSIIGKGVIQGQVEPLLSHLNGLIEKGYLLNKQDAYLPSLLAFTDCKDVKIDGVYFSNSPSIVQKYVRTSNLELSSQTINSRVAKDSKGIVLINSTSVKLTNLFIDTSGKAFVSDTNNQFSLVEKVVLPNGSSAL
ncbi:glycosyl hydrolase family 28 protein [Pedobacter sp.]|uniref:glycosyl hydrolase family 28 protein n=1 Tax=Pedobacter sp. TaxID=1411316 RepID=UPI003D7F2D0F